MKKARYPEEQIVVILKEAALLGNAAEVCRKYDSKALSEALVSKYTDCKWGEHL